MKIIALSLLLAATQQTNSCTPVVKGDVEMKEAPAKVETSRARIQVTVMGQFPDSIAYNGVRGIYLIRDTETGKEFFGVSGVGISELGSHGKNNNTQDER